MSSLVASSPVRAYRALRITSWAGVATTRGGRPADDMAVHGQRMVYLGGGGRDAVDIGAGGQRLGEVGRRGRHAYRVGACKAERHLLPIGI